MQHAHLEKPRSADPFAARPSLESRRVVLRSKCSSSTSSSQGRRRLVSSVLTRIGVAAGELCGELSSTLHVGSMCTRSGCPRQLDTPAITYSGDIHVAHQATPT